MNVPFPWLALVALALPLVAQAQVERVDPADPQLAAPPLQHQSAFSDYKRWQDIKPGDWRAVNDTVREAAAQGGAHAGHAMPGQSTGQPAPMERNMPSAQAAPAHEGHQMHGGKK